jgi:CO dehydrogenase/acetyl-CoA synthase beta subunit
MWSTNQEVLLRKTTTTAVTTHGTTSDADEATKCVDPDGPDFSPAFPTGGGEYLVFSDSGPPPSTGCEFMKGTAIIRPEDTGTTDVFMTHNNLGQPCTSGGAFHAIQVEVLPGQTPTLTIPLA